MAGAAMFMVMSSVEDAQAPLLMVHLNVALLPIVRPVTVELAELAVVIVAVPDTTLQVPVPIAGTFAAKVVVVTLHRF